MQPADPVSQYRFIPAPCDGSASPWGAGVSVKPGNLTPIARKRRPSDTMGIETWKKRRRSAVAIARQPTKSI
jgi:hypothetical protein